ncbi:hypothetical protein GQX74_013632 [Glossina fuscipes]|nr:hypothetical protein GQX74_013632 [Glossina fuscipes]
MGNRLEISVIPAVLAQLLLQFDRPSAVSNSSLLSNTTHRHIRPIVSTRGNYEDNEKAPNFLVISLKKNEATAQKFPSTNSNSTQIKEENWEFVENFNELLHFIWNDAHWLGAILVCSTLLGCFLIHHVDLRQRLLCARMPIAC